MSKHKMKSLINPINHFNGQKKVVKIQIIMMNNKILIFGINNIIRKKIR